MSKKSENDKVDPKRVMSIRIDPKLQKQVKQVAKKQDRTASWLVSEFIKRGLEAEAA